MFLFFIAFNDDFTNELINKAKRGSESAFCTLIGSIEPFVYNLALRMMDGSRQDAEDMSQEAFLRVYKALPAYNEKASFRTWALHICKNVCLDEKRRRASRISTQEEINEALPSDISVSEEVMARERKKALKKAIDSLDKRARLLIVMRDINGLSYKELAEMTDMEIGTVKSALNRARKKLREIITEQNLI